ncbi:COQ4 [Candida oxycetoniae]|uniref:4-hydroxy-3-methoxy-5-polyprenylbenzoate decarboxylase n=1 Tax=Candida oxycetoniae TaxID=497107 RepID=A0AAI9SWC1_9ASCO|nr:COQ4 [Candida oxycetoniae]KAI3403916.2 COQ4 [Candida oxycetoniae]
MVLSCPQLGIVVGQKRSYILTTIATTLFGSVLWSKNNVLASKMENGELHYNDPNAKLKTLLESKQDGAFSRRKPEYPGHVPLYKFEKLLMFLGSSMGAFFHPEKNKYIVALGESTAIEPVLKRLQKTMLSDPIGRQILYDRPRMTSTSLDLDHLRELPDNTIGRNYVNWLDREGVSPDTRVPVKYIDNEELAYIFQRYRECHDFYHAITGLPIIIEGEISVKVLEFMNIGIPMSGLGALFAPTRLKPSQRKRLREVYYPWAIRSGLYSKPLINVYWERILDKDIHEFRKEMGIEPPPDLRDMRKEHFAKKRKEKELKAAAAASTTAATPASGTTTAGSSPVANA